MHGHAGQRLSFDVGNTADDGPGRNQSKINVLHLLTGSYGNGSTGTSIRTLTVLLLRIAVARCGNPIRTRGDIGDNKPSFIVRLHRRNNDGILPLARRLSLGRGIAPTSGRCGGCLQAAHRLHIADSGERDLRAAKHFSA